MKTERAEVRAEGERRGEAVGLKTSDLLDVDVLLALLESPKLSKHEFRAFERMCRHTQDGGKLTQKQKDYARDRFNGLRLIDTFSPENLASSGGVTSTVGVAELERVMGAKVTKPPPSSRRY
jgi:hypothetical protein